MKKVCWLRLVRLGLVSLLFVAAALDLALAWLYVDALVSPACPPSEPLSGFPPPLVDSVTTADGLELEIWVYPSHNGATIIALGGLGGSLGDTLPPVDFLLQAGYGLVQVGSRACASPPGRVTLGYLEGRDVGQILRSEHLAGQQVGLYGFSMGGVAAIRAAVLYPQIDAVLAEGGYFNLGWDIVEPDASPLQKVLLYSIVGVFWLRTGVNPWRSSPLDDLPSISPRPLLLLYGENEAATGRAHLQFQTAGAPKTLWIVPGGNHGVNHLVAPEEYRQRVLQFFASALLAAE